MRIEKSGCAHAKKRPDAHRKKLGGAFNVAGRQGIENLISYRAAIEYKSDVDCNAILTGARYSKHVSWKTAWLARFNEIG